MTDPNAAQARELLHALHAQVRDMSPRLARIEREVTLDHTPQARALRQQAAGLRRDVAHAQFLIERLRRRYPDTASDTDDLPVTRTG
jgi:hypothetical protein